VAIVIALLAAVYLAFSVSAPSTSQFLQLFFAWLYSGSISTCRRKPI